MSFHNVLYDCKSKPRSSDSARPGFIYPVKSFEYPAQILRRNSYSGITHYLKAAVALKGNVSDGKAVVGQMKSTPTDDPLFGKGSIRPDGRKIHPAYLLEVKKRTGKMVPLGLEPEPRCYLETTDETVTYLKDHLFSGKTAQRLAKMAGINEADAAQAMRDYVGVVFDIGHQSVGFEDIPTSLQKLVDNGIKITKLQEAASMSMPHVTKETIDALQAYAKTVYLSQTCQRKDGKTQWFLNL